MPKDRPDVDSLRVGALFAIPADELRWRFDTSGGPGGQHANRSATRAEVSFDLARSPSVPNEIRDRMLTRLGSAVVGGVVTISAGDTRSQWRNRGLARRRLAQLLTDAAWSPRHRHATTPSLSSRRRRLERKRHRAEVKRMRRDPGPEE
jgi:ribosome-associated protein